MKSMRVLGALASVLIAGVGLTTTAAQATTPAPAAARKVVFHGDGVVVKIGHDPRQLNRTSPSFRTFLHQELQELWGWDDKRPECESAPQVDVREYRKRVAFLDEGVYAAPHHPECAGGGNWQFAVRRDGRWISPRALGGQDVPGCHLLRKWDIPRMTGAKECYNAKSDAVVAYR